MVSRGSRVAGASGRGRGGMRAVFSGCHRWWGMRRVGPGEQGWSFSKWPWRPWGPGGQLKLRPGCALWWSLWQPLEMVVGEGRAGGTGCRAFGCDVEGSLGSWVCRQEGIRLRGGGRPLPAPHGLRPPGSLGSGPSCAWGLRGVSSVQKVVAAASRHLQEPRGP